MPGRRFWHAGAMPSPTRRQFLRRSALAMPWILPGLGSAAAVRAGRHHLAILGGGLGGVAAALSALRAGLNVVMTEETDWIGGQLTQQGVPPDEHRWIEAFGSTRWYRELRGAIRDYYRQHYPLTETARRRWDFNPGDGSVSRLTHEPRVALAVLENWLAPYRASGQLTLLLEHEAVRAEVDGDRVLAVTVRSRRSGRERVLAAPWFIDATELGDLLPLTGTEFVTGCEGRAATGEMHTPEQADPANQQSFTACFLVDHVPGENHVIDKPEEYAFWRAHVPPLTPPWSGPLLALSGSHPKTCEPRRYGFDPTDRPTADYNLWKYRRIVHPGNFQPGSYPGGITVVNWPQNDYMLGNLVGVSPEEQGRHIARAKQLSLSLLYWLQTEAPRPDGGTGWPGLRLRGDLLGTEDGLAKYPYVRESRRIRAVTTVVEQHCGLLARAAALGVAPEQAVAESYPDSVGIGSYSLDLHPSSGGDNYIDVAGLPFQIPLGALLPVRMTNLIPACKNIGTTHLTNGCYRLHPVEWNLGEAAGALVAEVQARKTAPHGVREHPQRLAAYQKRLTAQGVELRWPKGPF